jgi:hypothetical protein
MKTVGDDGWFVYFRLYAPEEPFFDVVRRQSAVRIRVAGPGEALHPTQ